jgi:hypothetical protein
MAKKTPLKPAKRRAPQQQEINAPHIRTKHPAIEKLAKAYSEAMDDEALAKTNTQQRKRLALAAMQREGVPVYPLPDGKRQLRLDTKINVKREPVPKPKKRMNDGTLATVEASR